MEFARAFWMRNTSTKQKKLLINAGRCPLLVSSIFLFGFFTQHSLHNFDLSTLAAVDIGHEIKHLSVLTGAGSVKQLLNHNQGAIVVLNHPFQKQTVKLLALCLF